MSEIRHDANSSTEADATQNYDHLNDMSADELLVELEKKMEMMTDLDFDADLIDAYMSALEHKEPLVINVDIKKSLADFYSRQSSIPEPDSGNRHIAEPTSRRVPRLRISRYVVAAVVIMLLFAMFTAQALGFNILGALAHWTKDTFSFIGSSEEIQETRKYNQYSALQEALDDAHIDAKLAPTWGPDGFELVELINSQTPEFIKFHAYYEYGDRPLAVTIWQYETDEDAQLRVFERDESNERLYETAGVRHYIKANNGKNAVIWSIDNYVVSFSGDISESELEKMIDSVYEE